MWSRKSDFYNNQVACSEPLYKDYRDNPRLNDISALAGVDFPDDLIKKTRNGVIASLVKCLDDRFVDAQDGVICAWKIANFQTWPAAESMSGNLICYQCPATTLHDYFNRKFSITI